jgi:hypothetical protein
MIGMKKRNDIQMIGMKKRDGAMIGMKHKSVNGMSLTSPNHETSPAQQKSVLEKMTKNQQNQGTYA